MVGKHPSLADLDADDLKFHTDFRRIYATLLDGWLGCDSKAVLGESGTTSKSLKPRSEPPTDTRSTRPDKMPDRESIPRRYTSSLQHPSCGWSQIPLHKSSPRKPPFVELFKNLHTGKLG